MPSIFWVACPECQKRFYAHYELQYRDIDLFCPWCKNYFPRKEGKVITQEFADLPADAIED